jgi:hypothetical protein
MSMSAGISVEAGEQDCAVSPGVITTNPVSVRLSMKSIIDPLSKRQLTLSRKTRNSECIHITSFVAGSSTRSNSTAKPEHPPGRTLSLNPEFELLAQRIMRRMNFSAAGVSSIFKVSVSLIYTAAAYRGTSGLIMQVFGIGQIAAHCASSKKPMHSVHFSGSMKNAKFLSKIALLGHSL